MNDSVLTWHRVDSGMTGPLQILGRLRYEFYLEFLEPSFVIFVISRNGWTCGKLTDVIHGGHDSHVSCCAVACHAAQ